MINRILFQLIDIVGSVLDRPLIRNEFTAKYVEIIVMLNHEIVTCEVSVINFGTFLVIFSNYIS